MQTSHNDTATAGGLSLEVRSKLWLEVAGEPVVGRGRIMLLRAIDRHGSINQAARNIDVSYRRAWSYIKSMEERLGYALVDRRTGGRNGGGATLTQEARWLIERFEEFERDIFRYADERFSALFLQDAMLQEAGTHV